jgi:hypothetical protein
MIETAIQEECELKSQKYKANFGPTTLWYQRGIKQERQNYQLLSIKKEVNVTSTMKCYRCEKLGHLAKDCRSFVKCHKYGRKGHLESQCREQGNWRQGSLSSQGVPAVRKDAE